MELSRFERASGVTPTDIDLLDVFDSPIKPLMEARIRLSRAPAHIKFCLKQTLESDENLLQSLQSQMTRHSYFGTTNANGIEEVCSNLLRPISVAWGQDTASSSSRWYSQPVDIVTFTPERLPDAIHSFRVQLKRYAIPISDLMELALTEATQNAMRVLLEDNRLLVRIAEAYNNNPNFRHEVGRLTAIREIARSGDLLAGRDIYGYGNLPE